MCKVSVVLPVYNVAAYIQDTIESLLQQTFRDFELIVIDDCSTDDTLARVRANTDSRLRVLQNPRNLGRAGTDNAALKYVRGEFIAKMDGDDICHPERLARQVAVLEQYPDINVVGSWMQNFGASTYLNRYPKRPADAQVLTLFTLPTGNPSVMLRTSLFREQNLHYDAILRQTEDYDFFARYIKQLRVFTLQEALIKYRVSPQVRKKNILSERATISDVVREQLLRSWGLPFTVRELHIHNTIAMLERVNSDVTLAEVDAWLQKLLLYNDQQLLFEPAALRRGLGERWFEVCYTYCQPRFKGVRQYRRSPLAANFSLSNQQHFKLWFQALRKF
jgi:glycosyltransferase involved in cell wall biosynthesis